MQRHRYIRFFISSTFEDMTVERNLLQEVMSELEKKYRPDGWQIESVDLRWGITNEAGVDNRTMQICMNELSRCQNLSPKPNFIILAGQRRGWVPLPERMSAKEMDALMRKADNKKRALLGNWYKKDTNCIKEPLYILQPRKGRFVQNDIWETEVYRPLLSLLDSNTPSATEQEIIKGVFNADDAHEHAVAYIRKLSDVPEPHAKTYIEGGSKASLLHEMLYKAIDKENIYPEKISFAEYGSSIFRTRFKKEIKKRLETVINNSIDEYRYPGNEVGLHNEIAASYKQLFIGREADIESIDNYINDPEANHAIWYRCESGTGKSTFIANIRERYSNTHNVICRFCGATDQSTYGADLLNSIWTEMRELYPLDRWVIRDLPGYGQPYNPFLSMSATSMFNTRLHQIKEWKPLLILVDGMNQLDEHKSQEFFALNWIDCPLSPHVKVIITSTEDKRLNSFNLKHLQIRSLSDISQGNAMDIVRSRLKEYGRTLTQKQWSMVKRTISQSKKLPIYLTLLSRYLKDLSSYEESVEIPVDLTGLLRLMLDTLTSERNHDPMLVKSALSILKCERQGLSHSEMQRALSLDRTLMEHLKKESYHAIAGEDIPPILWSRLYYDLEFLFHTRHGRFGSLIYFYHETITKAIEEIYMSGPFDKIAPYLNLSNLYQECDTPHAIHEIIRCEYLLYANTANAYKPRSLNCGKLAERIHDPQFLYKKLMLDRNDLNKDFDLLAELSKVATELDKEYILNLKKDIAFIRPKTYEQFMLQCANAHSRSALKTLGGGTGVLIDELRQTRPYGLSAYASGECGADPMISADGTRLLSLWDHRCRIKVEDMDQLAHCREYELSTPVRCIAATHDLGIHAFVTENGINIYNYLEGRTIDFNGSIRNATWVTISANGEKWAYGNSEQCYIKDFGLQDWGCRTALLSPDGRFLWLSRQNGICRCDFNENTDKSIKIEEYDAEAEKLELIAASDCMCILQNNGYVQVINLCGNNEVSYWGYPHGLFANDTFIGAIQGNRAILMDRNHGKCSVLETNGCSIDCTLSTTLDGIAALSPNMEYAYDPEEGVCYRLPLLIKSIKLYNSHNVGINTISSSKDGGLIAVTYGKNELQEQFCTDIYIIKDGTENKIDLSEHVHSKYLMSCAVSPDGECIWVSGCYEKDELLCINPSGDIIARIPNAGGKLCMRFTPDGKYLVAVNGHQMADAPPVFHVIDSFTKKVVELFEPEGMLEKVGIYNSYEMRITSSGRYAIFNPHGTEHAVDLRTHRLLPEEESAIVAEREPEKKFFKVSENGDIEYSDGAVTLKASVSGICLWDETQGGLAVVSKSGRVYFFKRPTSGIAGAENMPCPCGSGKMYKDCHGKYL